MTISLRLPDIDANPMKSPLHDNANLRRFESAVLVHLDAAYNLARWLLNDVATAEDVVQDACIRAFRFFDDLSEPSPKAWFMSIVRNTCIDHWRGNKHHRTQREYDEEIDGIAGAQVHDNPEQIAVRASDARWVHAAIATLPDEFREVIVLRELEEMTYREISVIVKVPIGTVMSRLSRGRDLLSQQLNAGVKRAKP